MVRHSQTKGNYHVAPFRNRPAYRSLVRRRCVLRHDRRRRRYAYHADRLIQGAPPKRRTDIMVRSLLIGVAAFSTTIILILTHTGVTVA